MSTQTYTGTLTIVECPACHMDFGVTPQFVEARRNDHKSFYCPTGHSMNYGQKSEAEMLRERLRFTEGALTHTRDQLQMTEYQRRAQKGQNTRLKNRIAAGVCPCCNRSFQDLRRHMAGQHPDYTNHEEN
ncbi:hypothetical protein RS84_00231 [Microbacterium hydrocarbonoxydans]|uniref:Uncharacterized protein n=1 Tax=Microbacterium hydrocarbonoxydans TaxID=273678 RepID=A0A0M2HYJ6_9MICO|nr:hypothetical protein [Microbacterium hydrocarbonoxydans]KJL49518.1 hypothetical protein RS84_00231 [Microbacterium hydrocarbonoxydans]